MAAITLCSDFGAPKNKTWHCFHIYLPWSDRTRCHDLSFLNVKPAFSLSSFTFIERLFSSLSTIKGGVICISEVIDISPSNLDSSLCFIQPSVSHDVLCRVNDIRPWRTPFPIWNQSVPCPVLTVASWPAYRFLKRQIRWSGIPISFRIFHSLLWSKYSNIH